MTHALWCSVCVPFPVVRDRSYTLSNHSDYETQKTGQSLVVQTSRDDIQEQLEKHQKA